MHWVVEAVKIAPGALVDIIVRTNVKAPAHVSSLVSAFDSVGYEVSTRGFVGHYCLSKW